jgi:hypothetical protein
MLSQEQGRSLDGVNNKVVKRVRFVDDHKVDDKEEEGQFRFSPPDLSSSMAMDEEEEGSSTFLESSSW